MELINRLKNRFYHQFRIKPFENQHKGLEVFNDKNTIALFANPRGGSTWLGETLNKLDKSTLLLEPLYRGIYKTDGKMPMGYKKGMHTGPLDFWYYQPIEENEQWSEAKDYFFKLFNRELLPLSITYENEIRYIPHSEIFIYKFCFGNLLLPWVAKNFNVFPILFVRHPCAVVLSQLKHANWSHIKGQQEYSFDFPEFRNSDFLQEYKTILKSVKTPEENLAAMWALTVHKNILHERNNKDWLTISYEKLILEPKTELERIFKRLDSPYNPDLITGLSTPSKTTYDFSVSFNEKEKQLAKWKKGLSKKQIGNILGIVKAMGVNFYDLQLEPDYKTVYNDL